MFYNMFFRISFIFPLIWGSISLFQETSAIGLASMSVKKDLKEEGVDSNLKRVPLPCPGQYECRLRKVRSLLYHDHYSYLYVSTRKANITRDMAQFKPKCIPLSSICDGVKDCPDRDDETDCGAESDHYLCRGFERRQIPVGWVCDGTPDCPFGEDETACNQTRHERLFSCPGHGLSPVPGGRSRIPWTWKCDGERDCRRGEDEKFCHPPYPGARCSVNEYPCKESSSCIDRRAVCDQVRDCPLADDEAECAHSSPSSGTTPRL
jgi:hypothetical protein